MMIERKCQRSIRQRCSSFSLQAPIQCFAIELKQLLSCEQIQGDATNLIMEYWWLLFSSGSRIADTMAYEEPYIAVGVNTRKGRRYLSYRRLKCHFVVRQVSYQCSNALTINDISTVLSYHVNFERFCVSVLCMMLCNRDVVLSNIRFLIAGHQMSIWRWRFFHIKSLSIQITDRNSVATQLSLPVIVEHLERHRQLQVESARSAQDRFRWEEWRRRMTTVSPLKRKTMQRMVDLFIYLV